jgi:hypothetical protein
MNRIKHEFASFAKIRIISYKAWQSSEFQILKTLIDVMTDMIKERVQNEIFESCHESYRNFWFLMKKKKKEKYRFVNVALKMNKVIIRNVNLSSSMNEFFENFAKCVMIFLMNFFSEYDQMTLNKKSRDMTMFMTFIELYRMTTLSQRVINFVAQFCRIVTKILEEHISRTTRQFVNDFEVKKAKTWYNDDIIICEIRRATIKHIQTLNRVLVDLKRAECIVSEIKSQFCCAEIKIVDFVCDADDRYSNTTKVIKILN